MALILNIDTAVEVASVCLALKGVLVEEYQNPVQKDAGSWLHTAIDNLLKKNGFKINEVDAIAVTVGPGSYTGLRVGMATAKGLCYALSIPLIGVSTLEMMAAAITHPQTDLLCPMIDARRMEVFFAVYNQKLETSIEPSNVILNNGWMLDELNKNTISFFGNGSDKASAFIIHPNAFFMVSNSSAKNMVLLSIKKYELNQFFDLVYTEPFYGKAFYSTISKKIY